VKEFDGIYLSWCSGINTGRKIIGVLKKHDDGRFTFAYDQEEVEKAKAEGFLPYTELPNTKIEYNGTILDVFAQRLMKSVRTDISTFYDFWEIEPQYTHDKYYLLAHTQGLLPTDNFELLADYNPVSGLHFLTDLTRLSQEHLPANTVMIGDTLTFTLDTGNKFDDKAVKVFKGEKEIGYIKRVHSRVFHKEGAEKIQLKVKAVDQNGEIKRIFVKVFIS